MIIIIPAQSYHRLLLHEFSPTTLLPALLVEHVVSIREIVRAQKKMRIGGRRAGGNRLLRAFQKKIAPARPLGFLKSFERKVENKKTVVRRL